MAVMEAWTQTTFRYRDDDGSEATATWRQVAGTDDTLAVDTTYRMRFLITGAHTGGSGTFDFTGGFQYNLNAAGWNPITTTSSVVKAVASADTSWTISDDDATTEQLAGGATFVAGHMDETGTHSAVSISETQETESELVFQIVSADVVNNDTIEIRMVDAGTALATYTLTPSITVSESDGSITRDPGVGSAAITGYAPTTNTTIAVPAGSIAVTGYSPPWVLQPALFGLKLLGYQPQVVDSGGTGVTRAPGAGSGVLTGYAPSAEENHVIAVPAGSLTVTTNEPTVKLELNVAPGEGAAVFAGFAPQAVRTENQVRAPPVSTDGVFTGHAPFVAASYAIPVGDGSITLTGAAPSAEETHVAVPGVSTDGVLTGYAPSVEIDHVAVPGAGSAEFAGAAPTLAYSWLIPAPAGSITLTGYAPQPIDSGDGNVIRLPGTGALVATGHAPALEFSYTVPVGKGSITLSGKAPSAEETHVAAPGKGSGVLTGYAPTLAYSWVIPVGKSTDGAFTGYAPTIPDVGLVTPGAGSLNVTGYAPTVTFSIVYPGTGSLTITGHAPSITVSGATPARRGGRSRRYKYVVEVDGQNLVANTVEEARAILEQAAEVATESAENDVQTETPSIPRITVKTASGNATTSKVLTKAVSRAQKKITTAYKAEAKRVKIDNEIRTLMIAKLEREDQDEDNIIALLLM